MNSRQFAIISFVFCLNCACFGQESSLAESEIRRRIVCIWETFEADCGPDKVLLIVEAFHGRMRNGSGCSIDLRSDESPCFADVRLFAEKRCSGRRRCSFKPIDDNLKRLPGNCSRRVEKFLSIAYRCEAVYSADNETCLANRSLAVTSSSGYLSNAVTEESGKGASLCPWSFQPRRGQTVVLTLLDFGVWREIDERSRSHTCLIYAWIRHLQWNPQTPANIPICAGDEREKVIQRATTAIEVQMTTPNNQSSANKVFFLIRFQTIECSEIEVPLGAKIEKSGAEGIRIQCVEDRRKMLDLRCEAGHWTPEIINFTCPNFSIDPLSSSPASFSSSSSSYSEFSPTEVKSSNEPFKGDWSSIISWEKYLVIGGLLFVVVVVVVVVVVFMCRNRRIERKRKSESYETPFADNVYYSGQLILSEGIYDEIADTHLPRIPQERPSSHSVPSGTKANIDPLSGRSLDDHQSQDALSGGGGGGGGGDPRNQCTDRLAAEDSTYLVPREEERNSFSPTVYQQAHPKENF